MRYWTHPTKLVNWRNRYRMASGNLKKVSHVQFHLRLRRCLSELSFCLIAHPTDLSVFLFSLVLSFSLLYLPSGCWGLSEVLSRGVRHCQNQNAANASDSVRSRAQFFSILLWNYQFASAGLSLSQTGRCFLRRLDDDANDVFFFVLFYTNCIKSLMCQEPSR